MELYIVVTNESLIEKLNSLGDLSSKNDTLQQALLAGLNQTCSDESHYDVIDKSVHTVDPVLNMKIEEMHSTMNKISATLLNSKTKGIVGENVTAKLICDACPDEKLEVTANRPDAGDYHLHTKNGIVLIDVKLYNHPVPSKEIDKLKKDMLTCNIQHAILISLNSPISTKKKLDIEECESGYIIHMGNAGLDGHSMLLCISLMKILMKLSKEAKTEIMIDKIAEYIYKNSQLIFDKIHSLNKIKGNLKDIQSNMNELINSSYREVTQIQYELDTLTKNFVESETLQMYMREWITDEDELFKKMNVTDKMKHLTYNIISHMKECNIRLSPMGDSKLKYVSEDESKHGTINIMKTKVCIQTNSGISLSLDSSNTQISKVMELVI